MLNRSMLTTSGAGGRFHCKRDDKTISSVGGARPQDWNHSNKNSMQTHFH